MKNTNKIRKCMYLAKIISYLYSISGCPSRRHGMSLASYFCGWGCVPGSPAFCVNSESASLPGERAKGIWTWNQVRKFQQPNDHRGLKVRSPRSLHIDQMFRTLGKHENGKLYIKFRQQLL